jgi:hypothetical protein
MIGPQVTEATTIQRAALRTGKGTDSNDTLFVII